MAHPLIRNAFLSRFVNDIEGNFFTRHLGIGITWAMFEMIIKVLLTILLPIRLNIKVLFTISLNKSFAHTKVE